MKTIIQRLRCLGYAVHASLPQEGGGFIVRSIGRAECDACGKPHLYMLDEIAEEEMRAVDRTDGTIFMEWVDRRANPLGSFCNTCGTFSGDEDADAVGHLGGRLKGVRDIGGVISAMETIAGELATLSVEQLEARAERLEVQLEAVRRIIASRKGYRD